MGSKLRADHPRTGVKIGYAGSHCAAVKKPADGKRDRFLTLDEVKRLGSALDAIETEEANPKAVAIMQLWALTGCRRDEIAGLRWAEVDFEHGCLRLTDWKGKRTIKTSKSVRPLATAAIALLSPCRASPSAEFVFPSEDGGTFYQGTKRFWPKVVARAGLPGVTPHTLRHTIGSASVSTGETLAMTGALLGHANSRSTSIYAHMQQDPARRAADRVVGPIATALGAQSPAGNRRPAASSEQYETLATNLCRTGARRSRVVSVASQYHHCTDVHRIAQC
ncbi:MAG: site-specific integrase [Ilumatobacteraceae bacterium]